jgi:hypothetical protein
MVSGFQFPVSGKNLLGSFLVGRASVPAQISPQGTTFIFMVRGGYILIVINHKIEIAGQFLSVFSAHGSGLTTYGSRLTNT